MKKAAALRLYQARHLRDAACLHALCEAELRDIRQLGLKNPVCVIPNGVEMPAQDPGNTGTAPWSDLAGGPPGDPRKVLLYLGRVARKKGLVELIRALALVRESRQSLLQAWRLVVVGWEKENHRAELEQLTKELELEGAVTLAGPVFGDAKAAAYRAADAFVLPSMSEGLPLVVPEAWSRGLHVLMTPQCNLPEGIEAGAALSAECKPPALAEALVRLFEMSPGERAAMGERGRALAREKFSWPRIAAQMEAVYAWLTRGGTPPETVRFG
jgi:glycosyltransferase involved in cell wall biosynthesis